jgi:hypothetical protein
MMDRRFEELDPLRLSRRQIVSIAERVTKVYALIHGDDAFELFSIHFDLVYDELIYPKYGISLEVGDDLGYENGEKVLGYFDAWTNTIALDRVLADKNNPYFVKRGFTAWHELGHAVLHGGWMRNHVGRCVNGRIVTLDSSISTETSGKLERQANLFAAHAAMPLWFVDSVLASTFELTRPIRYIGPRTYQLYIHGCRRTCSAKDFRELCIYIAYYIRHRFGGMSVESLSYRVAESTWLADTTTHEDPRVLLRTSPTISQSLTAGTYS